MRSFSWGWVGLLALGTLWSGLAVASDASGSLQLAQTLEPLGRERLFGRCLATAEDLLVVGTGGGKVGSLYVYRRADGQWELEEQIVLSGAPKGARFGRGCDTDGERILGGAPGERIEGGKRGAAYVFRFEDGRWREEGRLVPTGDRGQTFGRAVAISGDHVVVGAPGEGPRSTGGVYAFRFVDGAWRPNGKLPIEGQQVALRMGFAVALDGRILAVGSDSRQSWLRTFRLRGGVWLPQQTIRRNFDDVAERFGSYIDVHRRTLIAGYLVPLGGLGLPIFRRGGGAWTREAYLRPSDDAEGVEFGRAVAADRGILVIGGQDFFDRGNAGSAYVFRRRGGSWVETDKLSSVEGTISFFGWAAAIAGPDVVVSDPLAPGRRSFSGAVYVFR